MAVDVALCTHHENSSLYSAAPSGPPTRGPTIGTQAYFQSDGPLPEIGSSAWASRGPKSRAGLIAYPVGPPSDSPIANTSNPTSNGPNPVAQPAPERLPVDGIVSEPKTSAAVPMISQIKFPATSRIAGAVQKTASFVAGSD